MLNKGKIMAFVMATAIVSSGVLVAEARAREIKPEKADVFYIYTERGSRLNHYIPSGWMGDYGDVKFNPGWSKNPPKPKKARRKEDKTCMQIKYSAERKQGAGWAGIYWQHPANNWGDKRGGYDLSKYKKLKFWARGEKGEEIIDKIFIGGITGQTEEGDSDEASLSPVELTKKWQEYEIDLADLDLSHIIGGFGFALNADANPDGLIAYIDEVRLVK